MKNTSIKTLLIAAATVASLGLSSQAFAQSFSRSYGTGNNTPSYYDKDGGLVVGEMPQTAKTAPFGHGLYAHHALPGGRVWKRN
ncbi:MAG TPA: hypothetical protein VH206_00905 [Xanthobacteraceae bacterium]|nr:hypothetical protein [Xanthobacteraceae bacterium]